MTAMSQLVFAPVTAVRQPTCIYTIQQLIAMEDSSDYNSLREYTFCSNTLNKVADLNYSNKFFLRAGESMPIPLRSNLHIKCGDDGKRSNNCVIRGGALQLDGTNYYGIKRNSQSVSSAVERVDLDLDGSTIENVVIEGFIFEQSAKISVWANQRGDITFKDCEWRDITNAYAPFYFDYFYPQQRQYSLDVNFDSCEFHSNTYPGGGAYPAMIVGTGEQNRITLERNIFRDNDYTKNNAKNSVLIESAGPLSMKRNCFNDNNVGLAHAASYYNKNTKNDDDTVAIISDKNYVNTTSVLEQRKCHYLAHFRTRSEFDNNRPICIQHEETQSCLSQDITTAPFSPVRMTDAPFLSIPITDAPFLSVPMTDDTVVTIATPTPTTAEPYTILTSVPTIEGIDGLIDAFQPNKTQTEDDLVFCFPGTSRVYVMDDNIQKTKFMKDVRLGDQVMVDNERYESVYSFGHYDPNSVVKNVFVTLTTLNGKSLTLTPNHMVRTANRGTIPASSVKPQQDYLLTQTMESSLVIDNKINASPQKGMYAPFTKSGYLIVDDIVVSNYIAMIDESSSVMGGIITHQWIAHAFNAPHRFYCKRNSCMTENYTSDGLSTWIAKPMYVAKQITNNNIILQTIGIMVFVLIGTIFTLLFEENNNFTITALVILISMILLARRSKITKKFV
eukprot:CAMPEP_0194138802 /NCGR_PEP_ID=MMETSP0152-20130528/8537_1 /TAXON_ID=1049557 /ORGANISM="Thalassiothrix antarctica, Strain L6-D1" /LENGTH=672 /DNA_ID=CAMNT_0038836393 /DNA_START=24 /DNA_END=2042 /DNA_ORIENTATION=+